MLTTSEIFSFSSVTATFLWFLISTYKQTPYGLVNEPQKAAMHNQSNCSYLNVNKYAIAAVIECTCVQTKPRYTHKPPSATY